MSSLLHMTIAALLASSVSASTAVITVFNPGNGGQNLYGSVVGTDSTATTYSLQCSETRPASLCLLPTTPFEFIEGPRTLSYGYGGSSGMNVTCTFQDAEVTAACDSFGPAVFHSGTITETLAAAGPSTNHLNFSPLTITAGDLSLLGSSASVVTAAAASTPTGVSTAMATGSTSGTATSSASSSLSVSSSPLSAAAMPKATAGTGGALAAAAMALVLL